MSDKWVLLVDDSSLARMMVRKIVADRFAAWTLVEAAGGEEALVKADQQPLSVALVDYNMPGMNGLELSMALLARHPELCIYLVTANIQDRMRARAEGMGIGFIIKPLSPEKLQTALGSPQSVEAGST